MLVADPGTFIMERKMLKGIQRRAETRTPAPRLSLPPQDEIETDATPRDSASPGNSTRWEA